MAKQALKKRPKFNNKNLIHIVRSPPGIIHILELNNIHNKELWKLENRAFVQAPISYTYYSVTKKIALSNILELPNRNFGKESTSTLAMLELNNATGEHFNLPGHSINNIKFTILEQVKSPDPLYGRALEKLHIRTFNTFYNGINKEPWWL